LRTSFATFEGVRRRTWATVDRVTPELLDWALRMSELSCGDIIRHRADAELSRVADADG